MQPISRVTKMIYTFPSMINLNMMKIDSEGTKDNRDLSPLGKNRHIV